MDMNTSLSFDDRMKVRKEFPSKSRWISSILFVQNLVGRLTLDEMVAQMSHGGASRNGTVAIASYNTKCLD